MTSRVEKLKALAALHDDWFDENEAKFTGRFNPAGYPAENSDYNQHNIDMDASAEAYDDFARRAAEIFGTQGSLTAKLWIEGDHPRDPGGDDGGQFIEKGTVGIDEGVAKKTSKPNLKEYQGRLSSLTETISGKAIEDEELSGGKVNAGRVFKVKFDDDKWTVGKNSKDITDDNDGSVIISKKDQDDAEELGGFMAAALGLRAPATTRRKGDEGWIYQEFMPGKMAELKIREDIERDGVELPRPRSEFSNASDYYNQREMPYVRSNDGIRMALFDQLTDNLDRNKTNWLIEDDDSITAIDHGHSQRWKVRPTDPAASVWSESPFISNFAENDLRSPKYGTWIDNPLTHNDVQKVSKKLLELEPEFKKRGREDWWTNAVIRLSAIDKHAKGEEDIFGDDEEEVEVSQGLRFEETGWKTVRDGDFSGLKKVGDRRGFNPAGIYEAADGSRFYIKQHKSEENLGSEAAANALYKELGVDVPDVHRGTGASGLKGPQLASEWRNLDEADYEESDFRKQVQADFAVDAWLANWDVAGAGGTNNIELDHMGVADSKGFPVRVEAGGALLTQGTGRPKGDRFTDYVGEIDTMRDPGLNPSAASLFRDIGDETLMKSMERLARIRPPTIRKIISDNGLPDEVAEKLIKRRKDLLDRAEQLRIDQEARNAPRIAGEPLRERTALASTRLRLPMYERDINPDVKDPQDSEAILYDTTGADIGVKPEIVANWSRVLRGFRSATFRAIGDRMRYPDESDATFDNHPNDKNWPSGESIDLHVAYMTDAFDHSPLGEDIETYRGIWQPDRIFGRNWRPDTSMVGAKWVERGPTSTSPNRGSAAIFGNTMFRVRVPKGTGAIRLSDWPLPDGSSQREAEIVLQPHLRYRIVGDSVDEIDFNGRNMRILDVEVEPLGEDEEE